MLPNNHCEKKKRSQKVEHAVFAVSQALGLARSCYDDGRSRSDRNRETRLMLEVK